MQKITRVIGGLALCASTAAFASGDMFTQPATFAKSGFVVGIDGGGSYLNTPEQIYPNGLTIENSIPFATDGIRDTVYAIPGIAFSSNADIGDYAWGIHAGYDFVVKPYLVLGMELGYKDLGRSKYGADLALTYTTQTYAQATYSASKNIHESAVDFLFTGKYFVWQGFNLFGKAGVAYVQSNSNQTFVTGGTAFPIDPVLNGDNTIWRLRPEFVLGIGYTFSNHVDVHASYDYIGGDGDDADITSLLTKSRVYGSNMALVGVSYTF